MSSIFLMIDFIDKVLKFNKKLLEVKIMSNISRVFYSGIIASIALIMFSSSYARTVTTTPVEIACHNEAVTHGQPTTYTRTGDPKTQLSIAMNGVRAEGFSGGLITSSIEGYVDVLDSMSKADLDILQTVDIHVRATCVGSGRKIDMNPGVTLSCNMRQNVQEKQVFLLCQKCVMLMKKKNPQ
jgi:hypothetical protein